jgi:hypothetical protein
MVGAVVITSDVSVVFFSADSVCTSGAPATTETFSIDVPSSIVAFSVIVSRWMVIPERVKVLNPALANVAL